MWEGVSWIRFVLCGVVVACSGGNDDKNKEEGALACNQPATECRAGFADTYEGTYTGDASGRLIVDIDVLGGIVGTATRSDGTSIAIFGQVNEFGKFTAESDDGTKYTGQFDENQRFTGTWAAPDGSKGTFSGASTTPPVSSGTGGASGTGGGSGTGGTGGSPPVSAGFNPTLDQICDFAENCGNDRAQCDSDIGQIQTLMAQAGCVAETNAFFQCGIASGSCGAAPQCQGAFDAMDACASAAN